MEALHTASTIPEVRAVSVAPVRPGHVDFCGAATRITVRRALHNRAARASPRERTTPDCTTRHDQGGRRCSPTSRRHAGDWPGSCANGCDPPASGSAPPWRSPTGTSPTSRSPSVRPSPTTSPPSRPASRGPTRGGRHGSASAVTFPPTGSTRAGGCARRWSWTSDSPRTSPDSRPRAPCTAPTGRC